MESEINEATFQSDFEALAYPRTGVGMQNRALISRFLETRALAKAYHVFLSQKFVRRIYDDDRRFNLAHDVATATVSVLKNKLSSGELTDSGRPVGSLGALITTIVCAKHRDFQKQGRSVPVAIRKLGPIAADLFYNVAVKGMDLYEAEEIAIKQNPRDEAFIRGTVTKAVLNVVLNPAARAKYQYHAPRASEDTVLERGSIITGAPRRSPEEELLRSVNIGTIRAAVNALPSPQREIANAVYLSPDPPTEKELARRLGVTDVGYEKKKIKKTLMANLANTFSD